jgi:hypothetical protein
MYVRAHVGGGGGMCVYKCVWGVCVWGRKGGCVCIHSCTRRWKGLYICMCVYVRVRILGGGYV